VPGLLVRGNLAASQFDPGLEGDELIGEHACPSLDIQVLL
jgi:hypothetical protein